MMPKSTITPNITHMTLNQLTALLRGVSVWLLIAAIPCAGNLAAAPRLPASDNEVLERLPVRPGDLLARELAELRAAAAIAPLAADPSARLARRYFDAALERGDPRYVGYAEAVIARFSAPLAPSLRFVHGLVAQYRHDFAAAHNDFAEVLAADPDFAEAHAWRAALFLVQADYVAAQQQCDALKKLDRAVLHAGCAGLVEAYGGRSGAADVRLREALGRLPASAVEQRLWLLTRRAEIAAWRGDMGAAETHYRAALALGLDDVYLLAARADFLLDGGRPAEVIALLRNHGAADPLLLRLAEASAATESQQTERFVRLLDERFAAARQRGDTTHRAEEARFLLHLKSQPDQALVLAVENYRVQREPRDARVLLEAAVAAGDSAAALPVREWLSRSGFEDVRLRRLGEKSTLGTRRSVPIVAR
jgi:hypothetical protein